MRVSDMTDKVEVRFSVECKRLLDLCDELAPRMIRNMQNANLK